MRKRIALLCLLMLSLLMLPISARADGISYAYTFTNQSGDKFSFTEPSLITAAGTINISPITIEGITFTSANVAFPTTTTDPCFTFLSGNSFGDCEGGWTSGPGSAFFVGDFPNALSIGTFPVGGNNFAECDGYSNCPANGTDLNPTSLTISAVSAVPEPSSLVLLGSGALALLGVLRRKLLT